MNHDKEIDHVEHDLPGSVKAALNSRYGPVPDVPSEIDDAILADARRHFAQHGTASQQPGLRRRIGKWQWTAMASTVAAVCVLLLAIRPKPSLEQDHMATRSVAPSESDELMRDVDRNGQIDILDAFAMARQIRDGRSEFRDVNHDGRFDQLDIDIVANEAVKL